jgi:hypothetical protein
MRKILIIMGILSLTSCVVTFPGTRYKHLTEDQKKRVVVCNAPIDSLTNDGNVYLVTIEQMQKFLKSKDRVLIYEYASFCQSDYCLNPAAIENECTKAGVQCCIVSVSYEDVFNISVRNTPILAIEPTTLGKKIGKDCSKVFFDKLTGTTWKTRGYGRYYYYIKGEFKGCYDNYADALTGN